jgi:hypothetical protein
MVPLKVSGSSQSSPRSGGLILARPFKAGSAPTLPTSSRQRRHKGLGITGDDWDAAKHLVESLDKFNVPKAEKDDLLALVATLRKDIVEK